MPLPGRPHRLLIPLFIAIAGATYLVGNGAAALWDRDEPRYAECSREMLHGSPEHPGSDFIVPRFLGQPRYAKPPGIYWLQAAAMTVIGDTGDAGVFAARLPSSCAMAATLIAFAVFVSRGVGRHRAAWATFVLGTSLLAIYTAKICLTDAALLFCITVAQGCSYLWWRRRAGWATTMVAGVAIGAAGLIKGPVVIGVIAATWIALGTVRWLDRRRNIATPSLRQPTGSWLKFAGAIVIVAAITVPWLIAVARREPDFLHHAVGHDVVRRMTSGLEGHWAPPGFYLVTIWLTFFPWSVLLPMTMVFAWQHRRLPIIRFAFAAVVGPWLMFECFGTKLPHYLLPIFPPLALLAGDAIVRCLRGERGDLASNAFVGAMRIWLVVMLALAMAPLEQLTSMPAMPPLLLTLVVAVVGLVTYAFFVRRQPRHGLLTMGVGSLLIASVLFGVFLPRAALLRGSIAAADALRTAGATQPGSAVMQDYKEPSLAFYQGGTIREVLPMALNAVEGSPFAVTTRDVYDRASSADRARFAVIAAVPSLDYAAGRRVTIIVLRRL